MLEAENLTLGEEVWTYLLDKYLNPTLPYFHNLSNSLVGYQIVLVVGAVLLGILFATVAFVFQKRIVGQVPRKLISAGATSEETAKTLGELGMRKNPLIMLYLGNQLSGLRKVVRFVGQEDLTYEELSKKKKERRIAPKPTYEESKFYVPEDKIGISERKYDEKGNSWGTAALVGVGCIVLFFVICRFLPELMGLIDNAMGIV